MEARWNGRWFEPPVNPAALAKTRHMSPHHASAIKYKVNQLTRFFEPSHWLDRKTFAAFALNYISMGNAALQRVDNMANRPMSLVNVPAVYLRAGRDGAFWWVPGWQSAVEFAAGTVFHLLEPDLLQELYGLPDWLAALQAGLLNEAATIFRRRYYINGAHSGHIMYVSEEKFAEADADELEEAMASAKGPGNFKSLFLHIPGGKEKGVQIIPVGEATAKDEFLNIKLTTRDDILAAHRVPPVLIGVVPQVTGGFGKPGEAADVFHFAEIEPLQQRMIEVNDWLGLPAVAFREYERQAVAAAPASGRE